MTDWYYYSSPLFLFLKSIIWVARGTLNPNRDEPCESQ